MNDSKRGNEWGPGWRGVFRRVWFRVFPPGPVYRDRQGWYW